MADDQTTEIFRTHLEYIKAGIDDLRAGQKAQNGLLQTHGEKIAVLEDRAAEGRTAGRNWGLTAGGIGSAIAAGLAYLFGK